MSVPAGAPIRFAVAGTRRLRRRGLHGGSVLVRVERGWLHLAGEAGGALSMPLAELARIRVGKDDSKHGPYFELRLWRAGGGPLLFHACKYALGGYAGGVRALAAAVAASRGLARVERGLSLFWALLPPLLMLPVLLGAAAVSLFILEDQPWWGRLLVPVPPALIFALLAWRCLGVQLPRPVRDLAELDRQLP